MTLDEQEDAILRLNDLIRRKQTGTPEKLAEKFGVSDRTMDNLIKTMKNKGFPIAYCRNRQTYHYKYEIEVIAFQVKPK